MINLLLFIAYVLLLVAILAAVLLPIVRTVQRPGTFKAASIRLGLLVSLFLVAWLWADDEVKPGYLNYDVNTTAVRFIGAILSLLYLVASMAIAGIGFTVCYKIIKSK